MNFNLLLFFFFQASQLFDDPEGKIDMPLSLKVVRWIRACDYIADKVCNRRPTLTKTSFFKNPIDANLGFMLNFVTCHFAHF